MSFFSNLFSKKKMPIQKLSEAIENLRELEDILGKKSNYLENKIIEERSIIEKNGMKNKKVAIQALKRMKRYKKKLQEIDGTLETINNQKFALEDTNTNVTVIQAMKTASDALKDAHLNIHVDDVHGMIDNIAEHQDFANEISEAMSNPTSLQNDVDDDDEDLIGELEALQLEIIDDQLLDDISSLSDFSTSQSSKKSAVITAKKIPQTVNKENGSEKLQAQCL